MKEIIPGLVKDVRNGDVLLFRAGHSLVSRIVSAAGRGPYCHAAIAGYMHNQCLCLEVREWYGGRAVLLDREVTKRPGLIDVYRLPAQHESPAIDFLNRRRIAKTMLMFAGASYGYWSVLRAALYHLPIIRMCVKPLTDDKMENGRPPYCSQAVAYAYRVSRQIDLVPNAADCVTEPADLARSALLEYQFTLWP